MLLIDTHCHIEPLENKIIDKLKEATEHQVGILIISYCEIEEIKKYFLLKKKIDGIYYSKIKIYDNMTEYHLIWHEDVGNYMYCINQEKKCLEKLEQELSVITEKLNNMLKDK